MVSVMVLVRMWLLVDNKDNILFFGIFRVCQVGVTFKFAWILPVTDPAWFPSGSSS
jgi:hypothetical protein